MDTLPAREVLLVEDEALVAMVAEEYLRDLGFEPLVARSAGEALQFIEASSAVAAALVDVGLPDRRGDDLARELRRIRPNMPVVMASGYDQGEILGGFHGDPGVGVLSKPYTQNDLTEALRNIGVPGVPD